MRPVAFYDEQLADPVDAFFDRLRPGLDHGVWRLNWNLLDDPVLFQPVRKGGPDAPTEVTDADAGDTIWFRVERQTLVRLPVSGAVVFGIRVHVDPLGALGIRSRGPRPARAVAPDHAARGLGVQGPRRVRRPGPGLDRRPAVRERPSTSLAPDLLCCVRGTSAPRTQYRTVCAGDATDQNSVRSASRAPRRVS